MFDGFHIYCAVAVECEGLRPPDGNYAVASSGALNDCGGPSAHGHLVDPRETRDPGEMRSTARQIENTNTAGVNELTASITAYQQGCRYIELASRKNASDSVAFV